MLPLFDEWIDLSSYDHFMQGSIARRVWARSRRGEMNPQYWYIANVDMKELSYENFGVLGDWFYNKHVELFRSIYLPCLPSEYDSWCANYTTQSSALFALPPEVLSLIFAELRDLPHVIALAITCRYLLSVGKAEVLRATRAYHAPWAGCRLICFGTDMQPDDLPERMLSEREREVMRDWLAAWRLASRERETDEDDQGEEDVDEGSAIGDGGGESLDGDDEESAHELEHGVSFPDVACGDYRLVFGWVWALARANPAQHLIGAIEEEGKQPHPNPTPDEPMAESPLETVGLSPSRADAQAQAHRHRAWASDHDRELFGALYGSDHWAAAYPSGPRALCNLSKGEYVREDALCGGAHTGVGRRVEWGHVLLARICWSSSSESGMPTEDGDVNERLCRGPWAGDRICITSVDVLPEAEGRRAWRDVSAEAEEVLSGVWKTETGTGTGTKRDSSASAKAAFHPWEICCPLEDEREQSSIVFPSV